ncbi:hypothetical protein HI914_03192 [Erysiphe necator]|nr:hypothetical protein HI914_03192 [Erysiphe necator]
MISVHPKSKNLSSSTSRHLQQSQSPFFKQINFTTAERKNISQVISSTASPSQTTPGYASKVRHYTQIQLSLDIPLNEIYTFVEVEFYLPTINGLIAHFHREIQIVDNLDA